MTVNRVVHNQQRVIQWVIVIGVMLLSLSVGYFLPTEYQILIMLLTLAAGAFIINILYPPIGLLVLIFSGLLIDFEIKTSTSTSINIVVILLPLFIGIWLIDMVVRQHRIRLVPSRVNPPLVTLAVISILAFAIGQFNWFLYARQAPIFSQLGGLAIILLSAGAFVFTANIIPEIKWLERLTWLFIIIGSIILFIRFVPVFGRLAGNLVPSGATGSVFWIWLCVIPFSQFLVNRKLHLFWRLIFLGLVVLLLYEVMVRGNSWKSGWIPAVAAIGVVIWLHFRKLRVLLGLGGFVIIWFVITEAIQTDQYSYITRLEAWKIIFEEIVKVNPILGLGPSNYRFYTPLFPIMGYSVEFNSHNTYIDLLAQIGFLGLFAFMWLVWELFRIGWRLLNSVTESFSYAYLYGALGGLVGMLIAGMLGDWILPFVYNVGLRGFRASVIGWIFLGGIVVIDKLNPAVRSNRS